MGTMTATEIRKMILHRATPQDLPYLAPLAEEFYKCSKFFQGFDLEKFVTLWDGLISSGTGIIIVSVEESGPTGAIGGVVYPEPYSQRVVASEFFWFVSEQRRGIGMKLYVAFEEWARSMGANSIRMCHMIDSMPEKLEHVYRRLGFEPVEIHYSKEL